MSESKKGKSRIVDKSLDNKKKFVSGEMSRIGLNRIRRLSMKKLMNKINKKNAKFVLVSLCFTELMQFLISMINISLMSK